jgi:hypothetical protein
MSDHAYDEGYRAGMQKMREVGQHRIEELEGKLAEAGAIAKDAIETMECDPFSPYREGQRLRTALAELSKEHSDDKGEW